MNNKIKSSKIKNNGALNGTANLKKVKLARTIRYAAVRKLYLGNHNLT